MITLIVFVVAMLLWLVSLVANPPGIWNRAGSVCAWLAVAALFFLLHGLRV
jgi:hypothetical protein